jgi:hypothetical protein
MADDGFRSPLQRDVVHDKRGLGGKTVEVVRAKARAGHIYDAAIATTTRRTPTTQARRSSPIRTGKRFVTYGAITTGLGDWADSSVGSEIIE